MTTARLSFAHGASRLWSRFGLAALLAAIVAGAAYGPLITEFFFNLAARPYYQHFPFVLAAFVWLLVQRIAAARPRPADWSPTRMRLLGAAALLIAWGALAMAYVGDSPWLAYVSLAALLGGCLTLASSAWHIDGVVGVWLLLWLIVPLPLKRDEVLVTYLQRASSRASSFVMDAAGVQHLMDGNALTLPEKQLFVDEACSGIISVMSIIACAAIFGVWRRRPAAHVAALIVAGIAWATVMNTFRISAIAVALDKWGVDWSAGTPHQILSLVVFLFTFLALMSTDALLVGLLAPISAEWELHRGDPVGWGGRLVRLWDWFFHVDPWESHADESPASPAKLKSGRQTFWRPGVALAAAFVVLPIWRHVRGNDRPIQDSALASQRAQAIVTRARRQESAFLPEQIGKLELQRFFPVERTRDDLLGNYSRCHEYRDVDGRRYLVSCDFPYDGGWHELTVCYLGLGWDLDSRRIAPDIVRDRAQPWQRMEADLSRPDGTKAFVTVCAFDEYGRPIELPTQSFLADAWKALSHQRMMLPHQVAFQVQVFTSSSKTIDAKQRRAARELMIAARDKFREIVSAPVESTRVGDETPAPTSTD